jgi:hypothetical protein
MNPKRRELFSGTDVPVSFILTSTVFDYRFPPIPAFAG